MKLNKKLLINVKKPRRNIYGKIQLNGMNKRHNDLSLWGLSYLQLESKKFILDIGCGGGKNIENLLKFSANSIVFGLDYSLASVKASIKLNKKAVRAGKVKVFQADVRELPFDDNTFDLITAFETIYFWKDIDKAFREVHRVLQKGGTFFICNESKSPDGLEQHIKFLDMDVYNGEQIKDFMIRAGFTNIHINEHPNNKWLMVRGQKQN